jgi:hypothetical protein
LLKLPGLMMCDRGFELLVDGCHGVSAG